MVFQNDILAGSSGGSGTSATYSIDQSIRFNPADSTYMSRAVGSGGNTKTWTFSCWFKIGVLGSQRSVSPFLWSCHQSDGNRLQLSFDSGTLGVAGDHLSIYDGASASTIFRTNRVFRDPSAWYNLILISDTSNSIANERFRVYVNGQRETSFSTFNAPSLNADLGWNQNGSTYYLGSYFASQGTYAFDGYIAEMVHIDGTALEPSNFAETNSNGIWIPKDVSGLTFGTKGFHIKGESASDLGNDSSSNNNDFTTSGLASHDQVSDSPTNNFCVLNPISKPAYGSYMDRNVTGVNLQVTENGDGSVGSFGFGTFVISSGKWYYEIYTNTLPSNNAFSFGWIDAENAETATDSGSSWKLLGINQRSDYSTWQHGMNVSTATGGTSFSGNHTLGVLTDFDTNTMTITLDGSAYISKDFDTTSPTYLLSGVPHYPQMYWGADGASLCTFNFGQDSTFNGAISAGGNSDANGHGNFKYSVPTGALAICSRNVGS